MPSLPVVKHFNVLEDRIAKLEARLPSLAVKQLDLHPAPERLGAMTGLVDIYVLVARDAETVERFLARRAQGRGAFEARIGDSFIECADLTTVQDHVDQTHEVATFYPTGRTTVVVGADFAILGHAIPHSADWRKEFELMVAQTGATRGVVLFEFPPPESTQEFERLMNRPNYAVFQDNHFVYTDW